MTLIIQSLVVIMLRASEVKVALMMRKIEMEVMSSLKTHSISNSKMNNLKIKVLLNKEASKMT